METLSIPPSPHKFLDFDDYAFPYESLHCDFTFKLKLDHKDEIHEEPEFSFACENPQGLLVAADEIFHNGKIRPSSPVTTSRSQLDCDIFSRDSKPQGAAKGKFQGLVVEDSKEKCRKSNSTGFSKLMRCREDLKLRSYSNGRDAFIILNPVPPTKEKMRNDVTNNGKRKMVVSSSSSSSSSAQEKLYMMNRKRKESHKWKSFLPYKRHLFGFFANKNGFTRNLHPF